MPLLATAAIADRDQAAHDNPRGDALYDSAEQRLKLAGEPHVADTCAVRIARFDIELVGPRGIVVIALHHIRAIGRRAIAHRAFLGQWNRIGDGARPDRCKCAVDIDARHRDQARALRQHRQRAGRIRPGHRRHVDNAIRPKGGGWHVVRQGRDFDCTIEGMRSTLFTRAKRDDIAIEVIRNPQAPEIAASRSRLHLAFCFYPGRSYEQGPATT